MRKCSWLLVLLGALSVPRAMDAAAQETTPATVSEDKARLIDELREVRAQMKALQTRLDLLETKVGVAPPQGSGEAPPPGVTPAPGVSSARAPAGITPAQSAQEVSQAPATPYHFGERARSVIVSGLEGVPKTFLPDIGGVGDLSFRQSDLRRGDPRFSPADDKFRVRDAQLIFFSALDPYTLGQISIDRPDRDKFDIEEAFLVFNKLPGGLTLRAGQFRPRFGAINDVDTFQLPVVARPQGLARFIGDDGFVEPGINLVSYVPNPWDADLKADFNMVSGENLLSFDHRGGNNFDFAYIGNLVYSRELGQASSGSIGVSTADGPGPHGPSYLHDAFATLRLVEDQRHVLTWTAEGLVAQRDGLGEHGWKRGIYSLLDYKFALRYHVGLLADFWDVPDVRKGSQFGVSPVLTYFVSDNTRLRLQYTHSTQSGLERPADEVFVQATFSLGNLKPLQ